MHPIRRLPLTLVFVALVAFAGGCAANRQLIQLPYEMPAVGTANASAPTAEVVNVSDAREDRGVDGFLQDRPAEFVGKAVMAELESAGLFQAPKANTQAAMHIDVRLNDLSWAVPNHDSMMKTAFWTSFLTGGLGGLAYGSTDTPVFGRASLNLRITERATGKVYFDDKIEVVHQEKMAKLKCDTPKTQAHMIAAALADAMAKMKTAVAKAMQTPPTAVAASANP